MPALSPVDLLRDERDTVKSLLLLLQQEQSLLIQADARNLGDITGPKAEIVSRMTELANARHRGLAALGFAADETGMRAWLDHNPGPEFMDAWAETLSLAQAAREINRVNGLLIGKHLSRNQQRINVLIDARAGEMLYGADGQPTSKSAPHSLVA
jgi:flagella synthesis protein FlgN